MALELRGIATFFRKLEVIHPESPPPASHARLAVPRATQPARDPAGPDHWDTGAVKIVVSRSYIVASWSPEAAWACARLRQSWHTPIRTPPGLESG
ncbi:hypothetical protein GCM10027579_22950 [Calidifontibacter terrae]